MKGSIKEAMYYEKKDKDVVQCKLCPHNCVIADGKRGICGVRENQKGKLVSLVYGKIVAEGIDPIEKKPLFHFFPKHMSYSIATAGCNFKCTFCQNWQISQAKPEQVPAKNLKPEQVIKNAIAGKCKSIAYTYIEPTIFYEFALDCAKLAHRSKLKNVMVTNGFINPEPLKELYKYIDAANIDLKSFSPEFYKKYCGARLEPVLESIKAMQKMGVWIELTTLIIPGVNDNMKDIEKSCKWIVDNVGTDVPLHFSRFFPYYKMQDVEPTPFETLEKAYKVAKKMGIKYVYIGNVPTDKYENTVCPNCDEIVIQRMPGFGVKKIDLVKGNCKHCGEKINGCF